MSFEALASNVADKRVTPCVTDGDTGQFEVAGFVDGGNERSAGISHSNRAHCCGVTRADTLPRGIECDSGVVASDAIQHAPGACSIKEHREVHAMELAGLAGVGTLTARAAIFVITHTIRAHKSKGFPLETDVEQS